MSKNEKLWPSQEAALELLELVKIVCKENNLKYMLIEESALALYANQGFLPWSSTITVGMFYKEYVTFLKVFDEKYKGSKYYTITNENTEQFNEGYSRIAKRSRVKLGEGREKDEKYYDFFINIKPIFYAGNNVAEYRKMEAAYNKYFRILLSNKFNRNLIRNRMVSYQTLRSAYYYTKRGNYGYEDMMNTLTTYSEPTKYVFIPDYDGFNSKRNPKSMEISFYTNLEEKNFSGCVVNSVGNIEQFVNYRYGRKLEDVIKNTPIIKFELIGGEVLRRVQLIQLELCLEFDRICRKHGIKYMLGAGTALGAKRHKGFIPWDDDMDVFMVYEEYEKFQKIANEELDKEKYFLKNQDSDKDCNLIYSQLKRNNTFYSKANREGYSTHPGVMLDILPIFNAPKNPIKRALQNRICKFYKTMTWSHIGANSERNRIKRWYYLKLAKRGNKYAYNKFMKWATWVKEPSENLSFFDIIQNYADNPVNWRKTYTELQEVEYEGYKLYATKDLDRYLKYAYGIDYNRYMSIKNRTSKHAPAVIDIGGLYEFAKEDADESDIIGSR